ncbi:MAG TPA: 30S ribosomal protein S1 [Bryobacteraceae bacterium]|nr:30S ribosomal protein S1 [Bryobacteraceae bacterium]
MSHPDPIEPAINEQNSGQEETSFGDILSRFEQEQHEPADAPGKPLEGTVIALQEEFVLVDIGRKTEGVVPIAAVRDDKGELAVKVGDKLLVNVTGRNAEGYYELSTIRVERPKDWTGLQAAFAEGRIVGGVVQELIKGGLRVDIGARAFMPASRSGARDVPEMEKLVGQEIRCRITKLDIDKEDVVVDRRVVLEEEDRQRKESAFQAINEGQVIQATVKTLLEFGAFVDLGGVDGLLHVADISWTRVGKPADVLNVGDSVEVKVLKVNPETRKISLGMKQLQPDPWSVAAEQFKVGDRIRGTVARIADFGAFVNLAPGVDGLVHVSEMSWSRKIRRPQDLVKTGEQVEVVVLGVNAGEKRISLGLKQALGDPWEEAQKKYPVGSIVEATITSMANFGAFVDLGEGIEGMIHVGDITREKRIDHPNVLLKTGQTVRAQVLEFDKDRRRIRLGMKQLEPTSADVWISEHAIGETVTGRVVDVRSDRLKVELGEGVHGSCHVSAGEARQESAGGGSSRADISQLGEMLKQRWKSGPDFEAEQKVVRQGQVRQFKLTSVDPESRKIELELVNA